MEPDPREYPSERCIHHLFEEQAARTPESIAAVFEDQRLTFRELDAASNRLARHLQTLGVGPETIVGICLDRSLEMLVGLLAVLKAGGAYLPLDPYYPRERIGAVIEDSAPSLILTREDIASRLGPVPCRLVCLDQTRAANMSESSQKPETQVSPRDLAYLIFTSGSTGRPKGVEISHRSVVNLLSSMASRPGLGPQDTLLAVTTLSFDIAVLELFLPLVVGARVVIAAREDVTDGNRLLGLLAASGATVMQATPATWRLLLEAGWNGRPQIKVLCGGEALPRDLADALLARSISVWNMYGPTETTVWSATSRVEPGPEPLTIGPPIANTQFFVVDGSGRPVPIGVPGELLIGGDGVARGYWKQAELSAQKFIRNSLVDDATSLLYKTGDLVRYLPNGRLEFLGRLDSQVKVRGFRIETSEVEAVIVKFPGVRECVVVAREDAPGDKRLVAYLVAEGLPQARGELRGFIAAKLPEFMVPTNFVTLDALPRTPNGKVDRRRLPAPETLDGRSAPGYVAASSPPSERSPTSARRCFTSIGSASTTVCLNSARTPCTCFRLSPGQAKWESPSRRNRSCRDEASKRSWPSSRSASARRGIRKPRNSWRSRETAISPSAPRWEQPSDLIEGDRVDGTSADRFTDRDQRRRQAVGRQCFRVPRDGGAAGLLVSRPARSGQSCLQHRGSLPAGRAPASPGARPCDERDRPTPRVNPDGGDGHRRNSGAGGHPLALHPGSRHRSPQCPGGRANRSFRSPHH